MTYDPVRRLQMRIADAILAMAKAIGPAETFQWLKGFTVAFGNGIMSADDRRAAVLDAIAIDERNRPGDLHSVAGLRTKLGWQPETFDDAMVSLLDAGEIRGHQTDLVDDAVRSEAVEWRGVWIVGVYPKR